MTKVELKSICQIPSSEYGVYDFTGMPWWNDQSKGHFKFLSDKLVRFSGVFWIKTPKGYWNEVGANEKAVVSTILNYYPTFDINGIKMAMIEQGVKQFMKEGMIVFSHTVYMPLCPEFLEIDGFPVINTWRDDRKAGNSDDLPASEPILRLIRESLCSAWDAKTLEEMIGEITGPKKTEFKWVIHWLASIYQFPGIRNQSNLWFIGKSQGIGKGTLVNIFSQIVGYAHVNSVNEDEIQRGWSNHIANGLLNEADEFKDGDFKSMDRFLKKNTTNSRITVTKRNHGTITLPWNSSHWIFSTNEVFPMIVDRSNRRDMLVQTTGLESVWRMKAKHIQDALKREGATVDGWTAAQMISGFAALLGSIEVDRDFVCFPMETQLKQNLIDVSGDPITEIANAIMSEPATTLEGKVASWCLGQGIKREYTDVVLLGEFRLALEVELGSKVTTTTWRKLKTNGISKDVVFKSVRSHTGNRFMDKKGEVVGKGVRV